MITLTDSTQAALRRIATAPATSDQYRPPEPTQHTTRYAMEQNTATPHPDWAALGWITHRQPTGADADGLSEVVVPDAIDATRRKGKARTCDYRLIVSGQPWWSAYAASAEPELQGPKPAPDYGRVPEIATEAQIRSAAQYLVKKQGCDGDLVPAIRYAIARWGRPAIKPVPVSERPWERDGWCDAEGMCWWGHLRRFQPENRIVHSWGLAAPGRLDASTVCLPHWALPIPTSQEDYE